MTLQTAVQSLDPGEIVSLFRLDTTSVGGPVLYFCQSAFESTPVVFSGLTYTPVDVSFSGLETNGQGQLPTPKIQLANHNGIFQSMVNTYGDMLGCTVQRVRTFRRFLDGQPEADPTAYMGPDSFRVERKSAENAVFIEWELSAAIDNEGKMLPGRQVIRDTCMWRYRRWTGSGYDYANVTCPYTGGQAFDRSDQPTTPDKDYPSRKLSCCEARFGKGVPLPFGGFPGVARVKP